MKKWHAALILIVIGLGLYYLRVFPDPYHQGDNVNIFTWILREIDELIHGEKDTTTAKTSISRGSTRRKSGRRR